MAKEFFKNFPEIKYKLDDGRVIFIKDFFRKSKIEQQAVESIVDYTFYEIQNGERPDIVATKLYGNPDLHWTFFLVNELENYYDWHMDQETFRKYLDKKYVISFFQSQKIKFPAKICKILNGSNLNEIQLVPKINKNKGFFEKFFQLFS